MDNQNNHFYPFFWQHGEDEATLVHYVKKIYESGMRAVCIESRPHPDFVGDRWWQDLGIIVRECKKRDMKIWVLDDLHFPTGSVNGLIKTKYSHLRKTYLAMRRFDVVGPFQGARIDASLLKGRVWEKGWKMQSLLGVYIAERQNIRNQMDDPIKSESLVDISSQFKEDTIYLDIPKGNWSVFVLFTTPDGGEEMTKDYLNPLQAEATQVLVDEVYEKHWEQLGQEFGKTITAFFSDEPRFGNIKGCDAILGKTDMVLPWREGLEAELPFKKSYLPLLWVSSDIEQEREVRYAYMDLVTRLYNQNFVRILADWCQKHGVDYLGHNIEDNGAHARLGYGTGHFFRGQEAQHYSGIDVIGGQIVPGMPYHHDAYQTGGSDGQFYHYALAKLGASAAHLTPHKEGRAMCEAYGAYGWNAGLKTMKWITDHLMVRGINTIVPHAFSPKEYPDFDCPPHFYAHGYNPQFRYMPQLTNYANRVMNILSDGQHVAPLAVVYPAEFEWVGEAMPVEKVTRVLVENQLDMDIVSFDHLLTAQVKEGLLTIHQEQFKALIVPYAEYLPRESISILNRLLSLGLRIIFVNDSPINSSELISPPEVVVLDKLASRLQSLGDIHLTTPHKDLVYYRYKKKGKDYLFFFNESVSEILNTRVLFNQRVGKPVAYDAYKDKYYSVVDDYLVLEPYETLFWIFDDNNQIIQNKESVSSHLLEVDWKISYASSKSYPHFELVSEKGAIGPLNLLPIYERKSGTVSYETIIEVSEANKIIGLSLENAYEIAEVFVNDRSADVRIAPPYQFYVKNLFKNGENTLRIEVTNTLGTEHRGGFNQYLLIEPFGVTGKICLEKIE